MAMSNVGDIEIENSQLHLEEVEAEVAEEEFDARLYFENSVETFVRYLYDEYKQDIPLPCICRHYSEDVRWHFGCVNQTRRGSLLGLWQKRQGIVDFLTAKDQLLEVIRWNRDSYIVDESKRQVCVIVDAAYRVRSTGVLIEQVEIHTHVVSSTFEDTEVRITFDTGNFERLLSEEPHQ